MSNALAFLAKCYLAMWLLITLAAFAAMYKLWWERERADYLGKAADVQREIVWGRSGLSQSVLAAVKQIETTWPRDVHYKIDGDRVNLSYAQYLLIPRIPSESPLYILKDNGKFSPQGPGKIKPTERHGSILGLLLSVFLLSGTSLGIKSRLRHLTISFPEAFSCTLLLTMILVVGSRALFNTSFSGFLIITLFGGLGWFIALLDFKSRSSEAIGQMTNLRHGLKKHFKQRSNHIAIFVIFSCILWSFLMAVVVVPDDWDAWAIWGAKAKILALGYGPLADITYFGHGDYPLLWPSIWSFSGWLGGGWEEMWSKGWGSIFLFLCIWELIVIGQREGSARLGLLAGALFASIPMVGLIASWGYAEPLFWLVTTACVGCLLMAHKQPDKYISMLTFAAILAAAAAFTKNEGVLFAVLTALWIIVLPGNKKLIGLLTYIAIFSILYSPWVYWTKFAQGLESHALGGLHFELEQLSRAASRIKPALEMISQMWLDVRSWNIVLGGIGIALLLCLKKAEFRRRIVLPILLLSGYFVIILFHTAEIYWQVGTSWNRLTLHATPFLLIFCVFYMAEIINER